MFSPTFYYDSYVYVIMINLLSTSKLTCKLIKANQENGPSWCQNIHFLLFHCALYSLWKKTHQFVFITFHSPNFFGNRVCILKLLHGQEKCLLQTFRVYFSYAFHTVFLSIVTVSRGEWGQLKHGLFSPIRNCVRWCYSYCTCSVWPLLEESSHTVWPFLLSLSL